MRGDPPERYKARMAEEIEIKLRLSPDRVAQFKRVARSRTIEPARGTTRRLVSIYFDTPDLDLQSFGAALRIRRAGRRRLQTLKLPVEQSNGLQVFQELERAVDADLPELTGLGDAAFASYIADRNVVSNLAPLFTTEFRRTTWPVRFNGGSIEMALDVGEIRAGERRLPLCEIELELRSGPPRRLLELGLSIHRDLPVAWECETKAARGYRLAGNEAPTAQRTAAVTLRHEMTARSAFTAMARACIRQIRANEACARLGEDPEGVHQFRVGLRRLRALVGAYGPAMAPDFSDYLAKELDWLQTQFGAARDWDVFIAESLQRLRMRLPADPAVSAMLRAAASLRD
ncbi:MAG: CHAD domain-containing protein, partial [Burkholderiales bacterium]